VIEALLPAGTAWAEAYEDGEPDLFPVEAAVVADSVERRRREFATVRRCARTALGGLGIAPVPILPGPRGEPGWPQGVVGSMTHCAGYRGAAVARSGEVAALGVDAEPNAPLSPGVLHSVTLPGEREHLADLASYRPEVCWDRLLFSAKESVYKAWFPLTARVLDFTEAELVVHPGRAAFHARLLVAGADLDGERIVGFSGSWLCRDGLLLTAVALTRRT
jgi:4'-phosphopantetheinyl transferase EntD